MIKILYLFFILLFSCNVVSQRLNNYKKRDTVYLYFDINEKFSDLRVNFFKNKATNEYTYIFRDSQKIYFRHYIKDKKNDFVKCKSFLTENQNNLINLNDIRESGFNKTIKNIYINKLVIYIIDKKDFKRKKIFLKKVVMLNFLGSDI